MIEKVISGGQTGADQAGWRAAKRLGIATGGWMPPEFMTETGPRMQFKVDFNAREIERDPSMIYPAGGTDWSVAYRVRTRANVRDSQAVIWFGNPATPGGKATLLAAMDFHRDHMIVVHGQEINPASVANWIAEETTEPEVKLLMVSGNRESKSPGIGAWVEEYLCEVFRVMGYREVEL